MIYIKDDNPKELLPQIYQAIDNNTVSTWKYDQEKNFHWTPTTGNWHLNAYFQPTIENKGDSTWLCFQLKTIPNRTIRQEDFAAYHAHFAQMIVTHFNKKGRAIGISTTPAKRKDNVDFEEDN